jgi:hypothetical protein
VNVGDVNLLISLIDSAVTGHESDVATQLINLYFSTTLPRRFRFLSDSAFAYLCDSAVAALDSCQTDPYTIYDF